MPYVYSTFYTFIFILIFLILHFISWGIFSEITRPNGIIYNCIAIVIVYLFYIIYHSLFGTIQKSHFIGKLAGFGIYVILIPIFTLSGIAFEHTLIDRYNGIHGGLVPAIIISPFVRLGQCLGYLLVYLIEGYDDREWLAIFIYIYFSFQLIYTFFWIYKLIKAR